MLSEISVGVILRLRSSRQLTAAASRLGRPSITKISFTFLSFNRSKESAVKTPCSKVIDFWELFTIFPLPSTGINSQLPGDQFVRNHIKSRIKTFDLARNELIAGQLAVDPSG